MKNGAGVALAVAAGYYFGRRRKMRLATVLALAGVISRLRKGQGGLLQQGIKMLNSPELEEITERISGDLMKVGKAAATAATNRHINALSDKLHERAEGLRVPGVPGTADVADVPGKAGEAAGKTGEAAGRTGEAAKAAMKTVRKPAAKAGEDGDGDGRAAPAPGGSGEAAAAEPHEEERPEPQSGQQPPVRRTARARG